MSLNIVNPNTGELTPVLNTIAYADIPIGTIISSVEDTVPSADYLLCNGAEVKIDDYSDLFSIIGHKFKGNKTPETGYFILPDLRETTLVGASTNNNDTYTIAAHDLYSVGEFKDDQLQNISGKIIHVNGGNAGSATGAFTAKAGADAASKESSNKYYDFTFDSWKVARTGYDNTGTLIGSDVTHGKQVGINFFIKAKTSTVPKGLMKQILCDQIKQELFDKCHPINEVYVQFPGQKSPSELYGTDGGTWTDVTSTYAGLFFRAEGAATGNNSSAAFNANGVTVQSEGLPDISGHMYVYTYNNGAGSGAFSTSISNSNQCGGSDTDRNFVEVNFNASNSNNIYGSSSHVTPVNTAIKIWKRTA